MILADTVPIDAPGRLNLMQSQRVEVCVMKRGVVVRRQTRLHEEYMAGTETVEMEVAPWADREVIFIKADGPVLGWFPQDTPE